MADKAGEGTRNPEGGDRSSRPEPHDGVPAQEGGGHPDPSAEHDSENLSNFAEFADSADFSPNMAPDVPPPSREIQRMNQKHALMVAYKAMGWTNRRIAKTKYCDFRI